jgi:hypothetical protein
MRVNLRLGLLAPADRAAVDGYTKSSFRLTSEVCVRGAGPQTKRSPPASSSSNDLFVSSVSAAWLPRSSQDSSRRRAARCDFLSTLVADELTIRSDRLLARRIRHAAFRG